MYMCIWSYSFRREEEIDCLVVNHAGISADNAEIHALVRIIMKYIFTGKSIVKGASMNMLNSKVREIPMVIPMRVPKQIQLRQITTISSV